MKMTAGFIRNSIQNLVRTINRNKILSLILAGYILIVLTQINFGIPNSFHPFDYHMDEWAQSQSIRAVFRHGTPNVSGASHGTIFHYFLGGIYLIPFILLRIVNPFIIKNSLEHLDMQHRLFEILRLNTLLYGTMSVIVIYKMAKKYLKMNPIFSVMFFVITPIFVALSNYFKYDIALVFWILLSILFVFRFAENPTKKNFFYAGIVCALSVAVKLSAIPMLFIYPFSYLLFTPKTKRKFSVLITGILIFIAAFYITGIPDIFFRFGVYKEWLHSNLVYSPNGTENFNLGFPSWELYLLFQGYPAIFGHVFFSFFIFSILFLSVLFFQKINQKKFQDVKKEFILCVSLLSFIISMFPLKIGATGNRALVLLPFFALTSGLVLEKLKSYLRGRVKTFLVIIFIFGVLFQTLETLSWISTRLGQDPRVSSSLWIQKNLPKGAKIGIEEVPIFQFIPDIALKEYYEKQYFPKKPTYYNFYAIDSKTKEFPPVVFINNIKAFTVYQKNSDKKIIVNRLKEKGYKITAEFSPDMKYYRFFNSDMDYFIAAIMATPITISVYEKNK